MKKIIAGLLTAMLINQIAIADSKLVIKSGSGKNTIWLNEKYARMTFVDETPEETGTVILAPPGGMLANFSSGKAYMIFDQEKFLVDLSSPMPALFGAKDASAKKKSPEKLDIKYKNKGKGEKVAGLDTTKYEISIKGKKCFDMLLTKDSTYGSAMKKLNSIPENHGPSTDLCERVDDQIGLDAGKKYGYVVKSTTANGELDMILLEFKDNIKAPDKFLSFPAGYKIKTQTEMMQEVMAKQLTQQPE